MNEKNEKTGISLLEKIDDWHLVGGWGDFVDPIVKFFSHRCGGKPMLAYWYPQPYDTRGVGKALGVFLRPPRCDPEWMAMMDSIQEEMLSKVRPTYERIVQTLLPEHLWYMKPEMGWLMGASGLSNEELVNEIEEVIQQ